MTETFTNRGPSATVDLLITNCDEQILLIKRKNKPFGWALPGGFVDKGESCEAAAIREGLEETSLEVEIIRQFHVYSDPGRDPRLHTVSLIFVAKAIGGQLKAADDAVDAQWFSKNALPEEIAFDHRDIISDFFSGKY